MGSVIEANNLFLGYKDEHIIRDVSFSIAPKDFVIIEGASGSGKSTLIKSFYGEIGPKEGSLNVLGLDMKGIKSINLQYLRRHIGIVFQDYRLINEWTIEKNVMLPLSIAGYPKAKSRIQAMKLLEHVKLSHKADKYPMELSGGEQQRVAMARALANNPHLIIADEPTGNLDEYSSNLIWELLVGANEQLNATVVVVTHKRAELEGVRPRYLNIRGGVIHEYR